MNTAEDLSGPRREVLLRLVAAGGFKPTRRSAHSSLVGVVTSIGLEKYASEEGAASATLSG